MNRPKYFNQLVLGLVFCLSMSFLANAQEASKTKQRPFRKYATQEVMQRLLKENARQFADSRAIEQKNEEFKQKGNVQKIIIPIAFHFLYSPGSDEYYEKEVLAQLAALNRDFGANPVINVKGQKPGAWEKEGFSKKFADSEIQFCLAEDENKKQGVTWTASKVKLWNIDDAIKSRKANGVDPWDTELYLNVWIGHLANGISGYAQMPGGSRVTDGIVIDFNFFGTVKYAQAPYTQGKTLTHLIGSYLGLHELWNESKPCSDDYVSDTPIHNSPNFGAANYKHVSLCDEYPVEMTMNFMDNTDDYDQFMFTAGQKSRMQATLSKDGFRSKLGSGNSKCKEEKDKEMDKGSAFESNLSKVSTNLAKESIHVFPNPAKDQLQIEWLTEQNSHSQVQIVIYNLLGNITYSRKLEARGTSTQWLVDCSQWVAGTYFVHVRTDAQQYVSQIQVLHP
jgi:hypothetical protein